MTDAAPAPIPIVILNADGTDDTLECLASLQEADRSGFVPVLVDNGTPGERLARLKDACGRLFGDLRVVSRRAVLEWRESPASPLGGPPGGETLVVVENGENLGFAAGSNVGIRVAECIGSDWVLLLNNDTVVAPDALAALRSFRDAHPEFVALSAQIRHFAERDRVQNCGGELTWLGSRRYHSAVPRTPFKVVTFVTGCALLLNHRAAGRLTEDFFFGEEDYELALRVRQRGLRMACVHAAVVYHKDGATIRRTSSHAGWIMAHYVSRLIDTRRYYAPWRWQITRALAYLYLPWLLARSGVRLGESAGLIRRIESFLKTHSRVGRDDFFAMIRPGNSTPAGG